MKCPYCGMENKDNHCIRCKAEIPVPATKEKKSQDKPVDDKKKRSE